MRDSLESGWAASQERGASLGVQLFGDVAMKNSWTKRMATTSQIDLSKANELAPVLLVWVFASAAQLFDLADREETFETGSEAATWFESVSSRFSWESKKTDQGNDLVASLLDGKFSEHTFEAETKQATSEHA